MSFWTGLNDALRATIDSYGGIERTPTPEMTPAEEGFAAVAEPLSPRQAEQERSGTNDSFVTATSSDAAVAPSLEDDSTPVITPQFRAAAARQIGAAADTDSDLEGEAPARPRATAAAAQAQGSVAPRVRVAARLRDILSRTEGGGFLSRVPLVGSAFARTSFQEAPAVQEPISYRDFLASSRLLTFIVSLLCARRQGRSVPTTSIGSMQDAPAIARPTLLIEDIGADELPAAVPVNRSPVVHEPADENEETALVPYRQQIDEPRVDVDAAYDHFLHRTPLGLILGTLLGIGSATGRYAQTTYDRAATGIGTLTSRWTTMQEGLGIMRDMAQALRISAEVAHHALHNPDAAAAAITTVRNAAVGIDPATPPPPDEVTYAQIMHESIPAIIGLLPIIREATRATQFTLANPQQAERNVRAALSALRAGVAAVATEPVDTTLEGTEPAARSDATAEAAQPPAAATSMTQVVSVLSAVAPSIDRVTRAAQTALTDPPAARSAVAAATSAVLDGLSPLSGSGTSSASSAATAEAAQAPAAGTSMTQVVSVLSSLASSIDRMTRATEAAITNPPAVEAAIKAAVAAVRAGFDGPSSAAGATASSPTDAAGSQQSAMPSVASILPVIAGLTPTINAATAAVHAAVTQPASLPAAAHTIGSALPAAASALVDGLMGRPAGSAAPAEGSMSAGSLFTTMTDWIKKGAKAQAKSLILQGLSFIMAQAAKDVKDPAVRAQINKMIEELDSAKEGTTSFETVSRKITQILDGEAGSSPELRRVLQLHINGLMQVPFLRHTKEIADLLENISHAIEEGAQALYTPLLQDLKKVLALTAAQVSDGTLRQELDRMAAAIDTILTGAGDFPTLKASLLEKLGQTTPLAKELKQLLNANLQKVSSAESIIHENLERLPPPPPAAPIEYDKAIKIQKERLVKNAAAIAAMQAANSGCLKGLISDEAISKILSSSPRDDHFLKDVKSRFQAEIDKLQDTVPWYRRWAAAFMFDFVSSYTETQLTRFLTSLLGKIDQLKKPVSAVEIQKQHTVVVRSINDFLSVLKGTIKRVQQAPSPTASPETMIEEELAKPQFNGGYSQSALYSAATSTAIYKVLPPLGWTEDLNEGIKKMPIAAQWLLIPFTWPARAVVYLSEAVGNMIMRGAIHSVLSRSHLLENIAERVTDQSYKDGYTHSLNKMFYILLEQVWEAGKVEDAQESGSSSVANKEALRQLVANLFDVLQLSRASRHISDDSSLFEKAKSGLYKLTTDYSADAIGLILDQAKNTLFKQELIPARQLALLEAINASFETQTTATHEEMVELEGKIQKLGHAILNRSITSVVHTSFAAGSSQMQKAFQKHVETLCKGLTDLIVKMKQSLAAGRRSEVQELLRSCNTFLMDQQKLVENDDSVKTEASLFEEKFTRPVAALLAKIGRATTSPAESPDQMIRELETWLASPPNVQHVNSAALPAVNSFGEAVAGWIAFQAGKEFFDEAWSLFRSRYIGKGTISKILRSFVEAS